MTHEDLDAAMEALRKLRALAATDDEREALALLRRQIIIERFKIDTGARA